MCTCMLKFPFGLNTFQWNIFLIHNVEWIFTIFFGRFDIKFLLVEGLTTFSSSGIAYIYW